MTFDGEVVKEEYNLDCPYCGKHFDFEFDETSVYVRPYYLHLAYDHTELWEEEMHKMKVVKP